MAGFAKLYYGYDLLRMQLLINKSCEPKLSCNSCRGNKMREDIAALPVSLG